MNSLDQYDRTPDNGSVLNGSFRDDPIPASRGALLAACHSVLEQGQGPLLLTGEAGSGKTWICQRLQTSLPRSLQWATIEITTTAHPLDLIRRIIRTLGADPDDSIPNSRVDPREQLANILADDHRELRRWVLVIDEAQNASDDVLEEVRLLSNRLGSPYGFKGIVLAGRTELARRLHARRRNALESRIAGAFQLGPINAEEAVQLIQSKLNDRELDNEAIEQLHAASSGNPARLLRMAWSTFSTPKKTTGVTNLRNTVAPPVPSETIDRDQEDSDPIESPDEIVGDRPEVNEHVLQSIGPRLGESRPPLRFERGLIEVGWNAEPEAGLEPIQSNLDEESLTRGEHRTESNGSHSDKTTLDAGSERHERIPDSVNSVKSPQVGSHSPQQTREVNQLVGIKDRYATIQALAEWPVQSELDPGHQEINLPNQDEERPERVKPPSGSTRLASEQGYHRAESAQAFAPYGRLFSKLNAGGTETSED